MTDTKGDIMKFGIYICSILLSIVCIFPARADSSIYDVVNNEDMDTFSDMVILGYDVDEPDADGYSRRQPQEQELHCPQ